jgi:hypothetical protein
MACPFPRRRHARNLSEKFPGGSRTAFDLPTRGAEPRYISLLERDGQDTKIALPYFRARKVAVMTLRSEAEINALRKQAK